MHAFGPQTPVLGGFRNISLLHDLRWKMSQTCFINAQVCAMKSRRNFLQRTPPIHPIGPQTHVLGYYGPYHYCTNLGANRAELGSLMHKFLKRSCLENFHNERTRYSPLDPKHMFWGISDSSITG
jgi:hypothetical protein